MTCRPENPPQMRSRHTASVVGDRLFVFAGDTGPGKKAMNDTYMLDLLNLEWTQCRTVNNPTPRSYHSASVVGESQILVFGGYGQGYLNDLHCLQTNPTSTTTTTTSVIDSGGGGGDVSSAVDENCDIFEWTQINAGGRTPNTRCGHASAVLGGSQMYIFGGYNSDVRHLNDLHIFDAHSNQWIAPHMSGDIPSPRSYHSLSALDPTGADPRLLFLFGGYQRAPQTVIRFNDVHCLDTRCMKWIRCTTFGTPISARSGHTMSVINNQLYLFGGSIRMSESSSSSSGSANGSSSTQSDFPTTDDLAAAALSSSSDSKLATNAIATTTAAATTTTTVGRTENGNSVVQVQQHRPRHHLHQHRNQNLQPNNNNNPNNAPSRTRTHRSSGHRRHSSIKYLSDLHVLDIDTMTWREIPLLSSGRESLLGCGRRFHTANVHHNRLFIFGGHIKAPESNDYQFFNDVNVLGVGTLRSDIANLFEEPPLSNDMSSFAPSRGILSCPVDDVRWQNAPSSRTPSLNSRGARDGDGDCDNLTRNWSGLSITKKFEC